MSNTCPHGGAKFVREDDHSGMSVRCGQCGWLCDMCKADRADARTDRLVEGLALAASLIGNGWTVDSQKDLRLVAPVSLCVEVAMKAAAALRAERKGGER